MKAFDVHLAKRDMIGPQNDLVVDTLQPPRRFKTIGDVPWPMILEIHIKCMAEKNPQGEEWPPTKNSCRKKWCYICGAWADMGEKLMCGSGTYGGHTSSNGHTSGVIGIANCNDCMGPPSPDPAEGNYGVRNVGGKTEWGAGCRSPAREPMRAYWGSWLEHLPKKLRMRHGAGTKIRIEWRTGKGSSKWHREITPDQLESAVLATTLYSGQSKYQHSELSMIPWTQLPGKDEHLNAIPGEPKKKLGLHEGTSQLGYWPVVILNFTKSYMQQLVDEERATWAVEGKRLNEIVTICAWQFQGVDEHDYTMVGWPSRNMRMRSLTRLADRQNVPEHNLTEEERDQHAKAKMAVVDCSDFLNIQYADEHNNRQLSLGEWICEEQKRSAAERSASSAMLYLSEALQGGVYPGPE